jgi:tRNA A64-2'-O-ribosylphosphate transferase
VRYLRLLLKNANIEVAMPDALSKTVPIWCAVMNMILFPELPESHQLHVPPAVISMSEKAQIESRLPGFLRQLLDLQINIKGLQQILTKPLRPIWITRDSILPESTLEFLNFYPLILCTSSRKVLGAEMSAGGYIQGAGDDSESWSNGLTAPLFWKYRDFLLKTPEESLPQAVANALQLESNAGNTSTFINIKSAAQLYLGSNSALKELRLSAAELLISCSNEAPQLISKQNHLHLVCREGKLGSRDLRTQLLKLVTILGHRQLVDKICISCNDGRDLSVGIGLAILCLFFNQQGHFSGNEVGQTTITKKLIRQRLIWITTSYPQASPSRATLQSVNDFLFTSASTSLPSIPVKERTRQHAPVEIAELCRCLAKPWCFERKLENHKYSRTKDAENVGTVTGAANFTSSVTRIADAPYNEVLLYRENGTMTFSNRASVAIHRSWIWKFHSVAADSAEKPRRSPTSDNRRDFDFGEVEHEEDDIQESVLPGRHGTIQGSPGSNANSYVSIYFVKPDGISEDYIYQELHLKHDPTGSTLVESALTAEAEHLCNKDVYKSKYNFITSTTEPRRLLRFTIEHHVKGPSKNYTSITTYTPADV